MATVLPRKASPFDDVVSPPSEGGELKLASQTQAVPGGDDLFKQWNDWLAVPEQRAAMVQFGLSMLQPLKWGENVAGRVGMAGGDAGAAYDRGVEAKTKREKEKSDREGDAADRAIRSRGADASMLSAQASMRNAERQEAGGGLTANSLLVDQRAQDSAFQSYLLRRAQLLQEADWSGKTSAEKFLADSAWRTKMKQEFIDTQLLTGNTPGSNIPGTNVPSLGAAVGPAAGAVPTQQYKVGDIQRNKTTGETIVLKEDGKWHLIPK